MNKNTAFITGAAGGIGSALAKRLARTGHNLFLTDYNESVHELATALTNEYKIQAWSECADISDEEALRALAARAIETMGGCAILVNCAGVSPKGNGGPIPLESVTIAEWDKVMRINLTAPFILCQEIIPQMAQAGYGRVVNVASRSGRMHVPPAGLDYHASKAGMIGLSRALAGIYACNGVTVNCVAPGRVDTPMTKTTKPELLAQAQQLIPARRFASPDEIAASIEFLVSPDASYISGSCMDVNGGVYMN